jgi:dTMP kinase
MSYDMEKPKYIIFEGCDYTGKTTLIQAFNQFLKDTTNIQYCITKEPGSPLSPICLRIRKLILESTDIDNPEVYSYLFAADSFRNMKIVQNMLDNKIWVISDRCMISDYAYRPDLCVNLRQHNLDILKSMNPIVVWVNALEKDIKARVAQRNNINQFEQEHVLHRTKEIYDNYKEFFYENQDLNVVEFWNVNPLDSMEYKKQTTELFKLLTD